MENLGTLTLALFIDLVVAGIIVLGIYFPSERDKGYVLSFFAFNISIFLIASLFSQVEICLGLGFGLFAIFSILHYRSDSPARARNDLSFHPDDPAGDRRGHAQ